mgnify:CR=1 FL=1
MKKIINLTLSLSSSFALLMVGLIANFGCFGPGYCPDLPESADKFMKL